MRDRSVPILWGGYVIGEYPYAWVYGHVTSAPKSYFYRAHRTCHDEATGAESDAITAIFTKITIDHHMPEVKP